jgi:pSer/pThr/pTyr-binding forkhead associated (FHA) protein
MAKLYLMSDDIVQQEIALSDGIVTIGRLPNNTLAMDDAAVSGHHCRIRWEIDHYLIEDNDSLNGVYVNGEQIFKAILRNGDDILVGKHFLRFDDSDSVKTSTPESVAVAATVERTGVLTALDGKTDSPKYVLNSKLTVIGKSDMATIKLKGFFAPKVAANLMRREQKYIIASADKDVKISINGEHITGQHELNDGDAIDVAGFKFQFAFQE